MRGHHSFHLRAAAFVALVLLLPVRAWSDDSDARLESVSSVVADDGSIRISLAFNKPVPDTRVIRSTDRALHIVLVGAALSKGAHPSVPRNGEITAATFADFAGIGMRLSLSTRDRINVRTEAEGNVVVVHVPARKSDDEAPRAVAQATPVPTPGDQLTTIVRLSYADVSEVAGALVKGAVVPSNDAFNVSSPFIPPPPSGNSSLSSSNGPPTASMPTYVSIPAATLLPKDSPEGVRFDDHVAVDRRLNAVILTGTRTQVDAYKAVIATLDQPARSVLLEAQIVELTETGAKALGIDYSPNGSLATASLATSSFNKPAIGVNMAVSLDGLEQTGQAKILARPRIVTLDNRPAAILSGEAVPIFTSVVIGSSSPIVNQQVQYINVGVSLQILPRIADDGRITTQIFSEVSSIIDYVSSAPRIAVRQELTSAIVGDSESLIVGGLLQETEIKNLKKVPGLGNLPLVGGFFRDIDNSSQNTNLYIVLTPHIIANGVTTSAFDLPPLPTPTIPPPDASIVPGPVSTPPPSPNATTHE